MPDAVGIVCHPRIDIGGTPVMEARRRLEAHGFRVWTYCATAEARPGALGGPIVHPDVRAIVFMPLNPHSLFNRPIVLSEQARVTLRLPNASAILTCDGQQNADLEPGAEVQIAAPGLAVELVRFDGGPNFFELLRRILRWGLPLVDGDE